MTPVDWMDQRGGAGDYRSGMDLDRSDSAPGRAREFVEEVMAAAGIRDHRPEALLLVSELVTNAVVHARSAGPIRLEVSVVGGMLRCRVVDDDPDRRPQVRTRSTTQVGGLGLVIIDTVANRWGFDTNGTSKAVWFELDPAADGSGGAASEGSVRLDVDRSVEP